MEGVNMKSKYKLLSFENKDYDYDHYGHSELILKDVSSWIELEEEEARNVSYFIAEKNRTSYQNKYVIIRDAQNEIDEFLIGGIEIGKKLKEKEEARKKKNEEKEAKRLNTMQKNKKKKEE